MKGCSLFLLAYIFFISESCKTYNNEKRVLVGNYNSVKNKGLASILDKSAYIIGSQLTLNKDSTYKYSTCGNISEGIWRVKNDSVFLYCKTNKYQIDSLNIVGFNGVFAKCNTTPTILFIKGNSLENRMIIDDRNAIDKLVKDKVSL
jgi:hypothetical protein